MLQDELNKIIEYTAGPELADEVHKAKTEYQGIVGNIFEDDPSFETRMASFLEWYTFDRIMDGSTMTPLLAFIEKHKENCSSETLKTYENLTRGIHGIFIVKKIKPDHVVVLNLFDKTKNTVQEKQSEIIFRKNDVFEGRIVPYSGENHFTGAFCFHPQKALKVIKSGIDQLNKENQKSEVELKNLKSKKNDLVNKTGKLNSKIEKVTRKIMQSRSIVKTSSLEEKRTALEQEKSNLENQQTELDKKISYMLDVTFKKEIPQARIKLIQKFSYMNLKWERFRQIDINDIYRI